MQETLSKTLGKRDLLSMLQVVEQAMLSECEDQFRKLMTALSKLLPIERSVNLLFRIDRGHNFKYIKKIVNIDFPADWLLQYQESIADHPVAKRHFASFTPQIWSETFACCDEAGKHFIAEAAAFGVEHGVTVGIPSIEALEASLFSFAGKELEEEPRHLAVLEYLTPFLHHSLSRLAKSSGNTKEILSSRESEIVQWIISGKTNWEISLILTISECTVKYHIQHAMKKLGASSRTHLIAIALRRGLAEL